MTLFRQLILWVTLLFLLLFAGTWLVNLGSARQFLQEQLASHAQDTATSLGLSLSPHMAKRDLPVMESMINAVFDRGYYRLIRLRDMAGKTLLERKAEVDVEGVPGWFVKWVPLETPVAKAEVMSGWRQAGEVMVQSHPGYAYKALWKASVRMLGWFALASLLVLLAAGFSLRLLMRPLRRMEAQAQAISERRFEIQEPLPKTREVRRVVKAMNRMAQRIKTLFEEQSATVERLRKQVYQDALTGLGNRRYLYSGIESHLHDRDGAAEGAFFLVQMANLREINDQRGFQEGDKWLQGVARILRRATRPFADCVLARIAGGDFALLLPGVEVERAERIADRLCSDLAGMTAHRVLDLADVCHIGVVAYDGETATETLLAEADRALASARQEGVNSWHLVEMDGKDDKVIRGQTAWRSVLEEVLEKDELELHVQSVVACRTPENVLHREVLARVPRDDGPAWNAGRFYPMAERTGMATALDRRVMEKVFTLCAAAGSRLPNLAVNLSLASLLDASFRGWLVDQLDAIMPGRTRLVFEFSEFAVSSHMAVLHDFSTRVTSKGHGIGIDHFGRGFSNFGYLRTLRPDYVKIDRLYTDNLAEAGEESRFFIRAVCTLAHSLDIRVIAEGVEQLPQWDILTELNVDGGQGYLIERPHLALGAGRN